MNFTDLDIRMEYRSLRNDIVKEFYIPLLNLSTKYQRAVGFFSSSALIEVSKGITGLVKNGGIVELIASPKLSEEDVEAINKGIAIHEEIVEKRIAESITPPKDYYEEQRLNLLVNLIANGILKIKIAVLEKNNFIGMFHEKLGLLYDKDDNIVAFSGSMNESTTAFMHNYESIDIFKSWDNDEDRVKNKKAAFEAMWHDSEPNIRVLDFPEAAQKKLFTYRKNDSIYIDIDKEQFGKVMENDENDGQGIDLTNLLRRGAINIPSDIILKDYQLDAINNWINSSYRGIYDMATGTGKSFTALGSVVELSNSLDNKLATFIVCPYIHLVGQWEEDVVKWGGNPIIAHSKSPDREWEKHLINAYKRYRSIGKPFICITTNATFAGAKIQNIIYNIKPDMDVLLIVDEAHNFGAEKLSNALNKNIKYRLALSATIERYMDKIGTQKLFDYFGDRCIEYTLEQAIEDKILVEYMYYPKYIFLTDEELEEYRRLTKQLGKFIVQKNGKTQISESGKQILFRRARVLAGASNKIEILRNILEGYKNEKYILVYCGATSNLDEETDIIERQIDLITRMITNELNMNVHRFTAEEDVNDRVLIKNCFSDGLYQVLTAIKCLDEGVNIPKIKTAFILSSSRNPKEFIQRRGRLLRKADGKRKAVIYDFVTLPRRFNEIKFGDYGEDRSIIIGELARVKEFGKMAINQLESDNLIDEVQEAYGILIDIDNEIKKLEEGFDE